MGSRTDLLLVLVVVMLLVLLAALVLRRRVQTRLFPGVEMQEWADTARHLSLRERWAVERANTRGRAAPRHLAGAAVQRGRRTAAMVDRLLTPGSGARRMWLVLGAISLLSLVLVIVSLVMEPTDRGQWLQVAVAVYWLGVVWYMIGPPQRRLRDRLLRSVRLNEELVADQDPGVGRG